MPNVNLICVGKIKDKYISIGIEEYKKRVKPYVKLNIIELKEKNFESNINLTVEKESSDIIETLNKLNSGYNVLLDINGKCMPSIDTSKYIDKLLLSYSTINFIIGGSYGVSGDVKLFVNFMYSFSKLTFPHQLMRLIFLEQLYRWFSILNNNKYHK